MTINLVMERLALVFTNRPLFRNIISNGLVFKGSQHVDNKLTLLDLGFFSEELLDALVCGGETYSMNAVHFIWKCLLDGQVIVKLFAHMPGAFMDHRLDTAILLEHLLGDTFLNLFAPPSGFARRYSGAVVAIDVAKNGREHRGSGFLIRLDHDGPQLLVTCRHNVDPADGISLGQVTTAAGQPLPVGKPILSPLYDVALLPLLQPIEGPVFRFSDAVSMFDDVYTLGFPKVAGALPMLLGHRGEVNGFAELYLQKCPAIIISNLVAPGSSGCPVLMRDGRCVGMTIRWLEGDWDGEKARFSAALSAGTLREFLSVASSSTPVKAEACSTRDARSSPVRFQDEQPTETISLKNRP